MFMLTVGLPIAFAVVLIIAGLLKLLEHAVAGPNGGSGKADP